MRTIRVGDSNVFVDSAERTDGRPPLIVLAAATALAVDPSELVEGRRCPDCGSADHGRPFVAFADGRASECWVSLSRAASLEAAVARLGGPVGIDIESRSAVAQHPVAGTLLHPDEVDEADDADDVIVSRWTAKEALLKATGHGLRIDLRSIWLELADGAATVERWPAELALTAPARISFFELTDDVVGAIAEL